MPQRIYTNNRFHPAGGVFTLCLGLVLSGWYVTEITSAIKQDVQNFLPAFQESPRLTVFFTVFKVCAYVIFPCLFALMVYVPTRNLFFKRAVSGRLALSAIVNEKGKAFLSIQLEHNQLLVRDPGDLGAVIRGHVPEGQELRFKLGAFNRVLSVEKLP